MTRALLVLVASTSVALAQPSDKPTTPAAQARFDAGKAAYLAKDYALASKEFAAGFAAEPWSGFLFAWAQSDRLREDCASAIKLYERFLTTSPPPKQKQLAEDGIAVCKAGTPTVVIEDKPIALEKPLVEEKPIVRDRPFEHKLALGLGAGAAIAGGIGIYFYVSSSNAEDEAMRATTHPQAADLYDRAKSRRLIAQISGGASIALATAAVLCFVLHRPSEDTAVTIGPSQISFVARF